jgi:hypothetical protein
MQYNAADVTFNAVIRTFWETIASYHVLPRCAAAAAAAAIEALILAHLQAMFAADHSTSEVCLQRCYHLEHGLQVVKHCSTCTHCTLVGWQHCCQPLSSASVCIMQHAC